MLDLNTTLGNLNVLCMQRGVRNVVVTLQGGTCKVVLLTEDSSFSGTGSLLSEALDMAFDKLHKEHGAKLRASAQQPL